MWTGLVVIAAALATTACGGDDDTRQDTNPTTTTAVDRATWSEQLDEDCDELNGDYDDLTSADPATREEAVAYARDVEAFAEELVDVLDASGVPTEDRGDAEQLAELVDRLADAAGDLSDAAADGDADAATEATENLREVGEQINPLAESLDAPACGGF